MSEPIRPRARELEIVRALFDRHLLERAVNLADARWAGSGEMVRLAYQWRDLPAAERRERVEAIGPAQLSRFRALADLEPEFALVLDSLEERGVLGPMPEDEEDEGQVEGEPEVPTSEVEPSPPPETEAPDIQSDTPRVEVLDPEPMLEPDLDAGGAGWDPAAVEEMVLPHLDEIGDSLDEFIASEEERRAESVANAEAMMERVRARMENTARRVTSTRSPRISSGPSLPARIPATVTQETSPPPVAADDGERRFTPPPDYWLDRLQAERVVIVDGTVAAPTDDELVALANELDLELAEYVIEPGSTRNLFGRLRRDGTKVDVEIGPLASSLAWSSLVVVRGRMFPRALDRIRDGMLDIPGTRASVRVAPDSRLLVIP